MLCVQHNRILRSTFEFIINRQRGKTIPANLVKRIGKAVCVCHTNVPGNDEFKLELQSIESWLTHAHSSLYSHDVIQALKGAFDEVRGAENEVKDVVGKLRMLSVLMRVERADYTCIPQVLPLKMSAKQLRFEEELELKMKPQHVGLLIGTKGIHLKPLRQKFGADVAILTRRVPHWTACGQSDTGNENVRVKVIARSINSLKQAANDLMKKAEKIHANETMYDGAMRRRLLSFRVRLNMWHLCSLEDEELCRPERVKEDARALYKKRVKNSTVRVKATPVLENGYCVHCMSPFYKGGNKQGCCQFHKGFEYNGRWSCCDERCDGPVTHEMHVTTGCTLGRHVWRPTAVSKVKRKHNGRKNGRKKVNWEMALA